MPGGPTTFTTPPRPPIVRSTMASRAAISQRRPTRLASARPTRPSRGLIAISRRARTGSSAPLMRTHSGSASITSVLDQPRGRLRKHHPARRGHRFHPLRQPDLLADRGVPQRPRTDLTGDHPTRIQAHPHPKIDTVAALHLGRQPIRLLLNGQRGQAGPKSVILQRHRGTEHRHHPVAGELHRPAVAAHHRRRALHQLGHDLAQPLHIHRRRDVHRAHHIGEQHRHLLVLRCVTRNRSWGTALVTELGVLPQASAA